MRDAGRATRAAIAGVCLCACASELAGAQNVCHGPVFAINVGAMEVTLDSIPEWSFNCEGIDERTLVVLHRQSDASPVGWGQMWIGMLAPSARETRGFEERIAADIASRRVGAADLTVTTAGRLRTKDGTTTQVRQLVSHSRSIYEMIAYVPGDSIILVLHMRAVGEPMLNATKPAFDKFVRGLALHTGTGRPSGPEE